MNFDIGQYFVYWCIRIFVLLSFFITGIWISKKRKPRQSYWLGVLPLILIYSLAEGLRWDRETDYNHYYQDLTNSIVHNNNELLYELWISLFKGLALPYWAGFVFYSFILIVAFLFLIKRFPKISHFALPLFFIITSTQSENLIRQFFALSFLIFAIALYFDKRYIGMSVMLIISELIHFSAAVPILLLMVSAFFAKINPKSSKIAVALFVLLFFFWDVSYFEFFAETVLGFIPTTGTRADNYADSVSFFTAGASLAMKESGEEFAGRGIPNTIVTFATYFFIISKGFFASKKDFNLRVCYWCAYIAILIDITRGDIESYLRFFHWIAFIIAIPIGTIYTELRLKKRVKLLSYFFMLIYYGYMMMFSRMFVIEPFGYAFVWDR